MQNCKFVHYWTIGIAPRKPFEHCQKNPWHLPGPTFSFSRDGWRIKTGNSVQDCPNSWCIVKTQDHMERQGHCPQLQNQNDAFLGHFNLPVCVRNMDPYRRAREEDTNYRHGMLPKTSGIMLRMKKWGTLSDMLLGRMKTLSPLWENANWDGAHLHITRSTGLYKDGPTGHGTRRKKRRQTEKNGEIIKVYQNGPD